MRRQKRVISFLKYKDRLLGIQLIYGLYTLNLDNIILCLGTAMTSSSTHYLMLIQKQPAN